MSEKCYKRYKITTTVKKFETDNDGPDYLKEENGIFYAKENKSDDWQQIKKLEQVSIDDGGLVVFLYFILFGITMWILEKLGIIPIKNSAIAILVIIGALALPAVLLFFIGKLFPNPSFFKLSDEHIKRIIENNKPYKNHGLYGNSSSGSVGRSSRNSSSGGGSFGGGHSAYVPASDINKALQEFKTKGKDTNTLINDVSDEERESLFSKYFKDEDKGQYANDKFNQDIAWPARKQTLEKILDEAEYEDDETKENLSEKINNLGEEISQEDFQETAKEIRTFQERKRAKDNHIKYEGRLSNKDIQAIKEYHGYVCMGCGLDPVEEYGEQMKGILEAHHKIPWANIEEGETRTVIPSDFLILCPNCHRMIHKLKSPDDLDGLKEVLNQNKKSSWWD